MSGVHGLSLEERSALPRVKLGVPPCPVGGLKQGRHPRDDAPAPSSPGPRGLSAGGPPWCFQSAGRVALQSVPPWVPGQSRSRLLGLEKSWLLGN